MRTPGQTILFAVVDPSGTAEYGLDGHIQRWDGTSWTDAWSFASATWPGSQSTIIPAGQQLAMNDIGFHIPESGAVGQVERLRLPATDPGTYRLVKPVLDGGPARTAVLEVIDGSQAVEPDLEQGGQVLSAEPGAIDAEDGMEVLVVLASLPGRDTVLSLEVVTDHGPAVAQVPVIHVSAIPQPDLTPSTASLGTPPPSTTPLPLPPDPLLTPSEFMILVPATPTPPPEADGMLDCTTGNVWDTFDELADDATGFESSQRAVEAFLLDRALAIEIRTPSPGVGTVAQDDREIMVVEAERLADGTFLVTYTTGCAADIDPNGTTPALAEGCPPAGGQYTEEPFGPLEQTGQSRQLFDEVVLPGGRRYSRRAEDPGPVELGQVLTTTRCRTADTPWFDGRIRGRDATLLPVGTEIHAVIGQPASQAVAAQAPDGIRVYRFVGLQDAAPVATPTGDVPKPAPDGEPAPRRQGR